MTRKNIGYFSFMLSLLLLSGCLEKAMHSADTPLQLNNHPLVGKIWDVKQAAFVSREQLLPDVLQSRYLLLGETHDNISHHQHQAAIIESLANARQSASVHFEMIDDRQYQRLQLSRARDLDDVMVKLKANDSGWQYERMYRGVFDQVLRAGYQILPANLDHGAVRKIMKQGEKQVPEDIKSLLSDVPLSSAQLRQLEQEVIQGHCNALPAKLVSPMVLAQRVRDASISLSMLGSDKTHRILIAGSGHVRNDRGVPVYLTAKDPKARILTIGFVEVMADKQSIDEYLERWGGQALPFDYVWFTPWFNRKDPCEAFLKMQNKQNAAASSA